MRHSWWKFSAPLVLGGLAWAAVAADEKPTGRLPTRPGKENKRTLSFFSKSGKETSPPTYTQDPFDEEAAAAGRPPQRYVRQPSAAPTPEVKNFYKDLFEPQPEAPVAAAPAPAIQSAGAASAEKAPAIRPAGAETTADRPSEVVSAKFEQHPEQAGSNVQQVAGKVAPSPGSPTKTAPGVKAPSAATAPAARRIPSEPAKESRDTKETKASVVSADLKADKPIVKTARPVAARSGVDAPAVAPAATAPASAKETAGSTSAREPTAAASAKEPTAPSDAGFTAAPPAQTPTKVVPAAASEASADEATDPDAAHLPRLDTHAEQAKLSPRMEVPEATGEAPQSPVVNLRWVLQGDITVGQPCKCALLVTNSGKVSAKDVVIEAYFPRSVRLTNAEPFPSDTRDHLTWNFEQLVAGEEKLITIAMVPSRRGEVATSANVRFTGSSSTVLRIEEPQLFVAVKGPQDVTVGEAATQVITVSNPGTGVARDVIVQAVIPDGLEHARGKKIQMPIGALNPGESREVRLALAAIAGGDQIVVVEARGGSNLVQHAECQIKVTAPRVEVAVTGPSLRYVNRHAQYIVTVTNKGAAATNNARVTFTIPAGFDFSKTDKGGTLAETGRAVSWFVGHLDANQSALLTVELTAKQVGQHVAQVQVVGENGATAEAHAETRVEGSAALVMEVIDLDDPVEIKAQTAYEIRVKNNGSKSAQNLMIACQIPAGVELLQVEGPGETKVEKGLVTFHPSSDLAAQKTVTVRVLVQGLTAGNHRFRARLTSDSAPEPIIVEELTKFYGD